jgi:hypothetical protein
MYKNTPLKVVEILRSIADGAFHSRPFMYDKLDPIPLTPELLEKCGFVWETPNKKHLCSPNMGIENMKDVISFSFTPKQIEDGEINCYAENYLGACWQMKVKHLHTLQNIVKVLTGKELEVNF